MSIQIDDSLRVGQQKNIDAKYDNDGQKWTSVAQVMSGIAIGERSHGQQVLINDVVYWWHPSNPLTDNPVIKDNPNSTVDDGLVSGGEIDISEFASGNITVDTASWILTVAGVQQVYATSSPTLFTGIGLSTAGNQRYVAFYGTDLNTIIKVEGAQSPAAVMPSTPADTVLLGYVLVTDAVAEPPVIDLSGYVKYTDVDENVVGGKIVQRLASGQIKVNLGADTSPTPNDRVFVTHNSDARLAYITYSQLVNSIPSANKASVSDINTGTNDTTFPTPLGLESSKYLDRFLGKIYALTTGTSTAYVASLTPAITGYVTNQPIVLSFNVNSGASPTVNVNTLGARNLLRMDGTAIGAGDLVTNVRYLFIYDGTAFRMMTPIINENIRNQNTAQQSANFWALIGRLDTGLALGMANNLSSFASIAAATAAKAQLLLTQGTVDYTGTVNGMFWNNSGELKFIDNAIVNRAFKWYNNELGKSDGNYVVTLNQYGDASANIKVTERWVYDTDVLAAITAATWSSDRATITPANSKKMYKGQRHDDGTYSYEAIDDNYIKRW